ncbi:MAG: hypothetical protein ACXADH_05980, partial [Candidatus Kariarchaeaceae archaeon]
VTQTSNDFSESSLRQDTYESRITQSVPVNSTGLEVLKQSVSSLKGKDQTPVEFTNTLTVLQPRQLVRIGTSFSTEIEPSAVPRSNIAANQDRIYRQTRTSNRTSNSTRNQNNGGSY